MPSVLAKYLILLQKHKLNSAYFQEVWLAQPTTHFAFILYTYSNKKYSIYCYCQLMVFMIDDKADMVMPPGDNPQTITCTLRLRNLDIPGRLSEPNAVSKPLDLPGCM